MNNRNVVHAWAHQHEARATGSNFYFVGDTIYSYGPHFPIARIDVDRGIVWFTTRGYSNTTAKHTSLARQAIPSVYTVAYVDSVDSPERSFVTYRDEARGLLERRRTEKWTRDVGTFLAKLVAFFAAINPTAFDQTGVDQGVRLELVGLANRLSEARDEYLEAYAANSARREADAKKRAGGFELRFGQFRLDRIFAGTIYAGCHKIERAEVMRFAGSLGLNTDIPAEYTGGAV